MPCNLLPETRRDWPADLDARAAAGMGQRGGWQRSPIYGYSADSAKAQRLGERAERMRRRYSNRFAAAGRAPRKARKA